LESLIGRKLAIVHDYTDWPATFPTANEQTAAAGGRTLFIDWTAKNYATGQAAATWAQIANGSQDAHIDAEAAALQSFGQPIMLTFQAEPELGVNTSYGTAADYVAAWQHIHDRFLADGVTNVVWVWDVTGDVYDHGAAYPSWYPGDSYVDWIMWDPYNWYGCSGHTQPWKSFASTVSPMYSWLTAHSGTAGNGNYLSKPWGIAEFGTVEGASPTDKGQWFQTAVAQAQTQFPNLKALVYFASNDSTGSRSCDWRVDTSATSLAGSQQAGAQPSVASTP
jgi:beta-mannanase